MRILALMLFLVAISSAAMATDGSAQVPEIDGSWAAGALAFLSGAIVLSRSHRGKQ